MNQPGTFFNKNRFAMLLAATETAACTAFAARYLSTLLSGA
ncbi:MAG: hypothetical protein NTZ12_02705 [Candidatus Aminicenantes bacterium]|nr:hypothetical protein [Candidatus Aminicenantes bacterium]